MADEAKPAVPAAPSSPLVAALIASVPASKWTRLGAAVAAVLLPFLVGIAEKYDLHVEPSYVLASEGVLATYITQSVLNEIHKRGIALQADAAVQSPAPKAEG